MNIIKSRVAQLRELMRSKNVDAWIVPSNDPHNSEYVADRWHGREWISGFTGSAGTVVIAAEEAGLWTDGRYFIQAEKELAGSGIDLFKMRVSGVPTYTEWLADILPANAVVGFDGRVLGQSITSGMEKAFADKGITLKSSEDLLSAVWEDRPSIPAKPVFQHDLHYAGRSCKEKLSDIRQVMAEKGAEHHLVTTLDDVAWALNLRGSDVAMNPVFYGYLLVQKDGAVAFVDEEKVPSDVAASLNNEGVEFQSYESIWSFLSGLPENDSILLNSFSTSKALFDSLPENMTVVEGHQPSTRLKAIKNSTETGHFP